MDTNLPRSRFRQQIQMKKLSTDLLDVYPAQLCFPFKPNKLITCSVQLTNTKDDCISVRLLTKNPRKYLTKMPICGIVPPRSTYTIMVTTRDQKKQPPSNSVEYFTLESSVVRDGNLNQESATDQVNQLTLNVVSDPPEDQLLQPEIQIVSSRKISQVLSVDVHQTEPWILTNHFGGEIFIWDYKEQEIETSFDLTDRPVYSAKFIEREQWFVAGDADGVIHVYSYDTEEEVVTFDAHEGHIMSLAVHPNDSLVISSSDDHQIKLWNWEKGWVCARLFNGHTDIVTQVNFNPIDTNSFASASMDSTIKIWNISSSESPVTLSGHPDGLLCVQNYTSNTRQYLITGSCDGTAQIWDLETETCVQTLEGHMDRIGSVYRHPELPVLITGSHDGAVRLWNSNTYRLENIIGLNLGAVYACGYIKSLRRVVVACHQGIAIMEMN